MRCRECYDRRGRYEDPRDPPLEDTEDCLCSCCFEEACNEVIAELEADIKDLRQRVAAIKKPGRPKKRF